MASKRIAKKKPPEAPRPRQVVEVVEEKEEEKEALATIKKDAQEIESVAEKLEEEVEPPAATPAATPSEERQKEMVAQLFQKEIPEVSPEITVHTPSRTKPLVIWVALTLGIALAVGTVMVLVARGGSPPSTVVNPTSSPTPTLSSSPTPQPASLARGDLEIQVLNGSGVSGAASKMKKFLEDKGYSVVNMGNTKEYTYTQTEIMVKPDKEAYLALLGSDLEAEYAVATSQATLEADSPYDVRIIVGKE